MFDPCIAHQFLNPEIVHYLGCALGFYVVFAKMLPLRKHFFCPRKLIQNIDGSRLKKPYPYLFNQVILKEATHDRIHQRWHQRFRQSG